MLHALEVAIKAAGDELNSTCSFQGGADVLVVYGVGAAAHHDARCRQLAEGGRAVLLDLAYFRGDKNGGAVRLSLDTDHPQQWLDRTPADGQRWASHGRALREDANPKGPVLLIGLGLKSRSYLNLWNWERDKLASLRKRFPHREIVFRPKGRDALQLDCRSEAQSPIESLLKGASLVVCRHSNVAVDAAVAGVPFQCEDGAAMWLQQREFTVANRLDFLQRLAHWQYLNEEAGAAWSFFKRMINA